MRQSERLELLSALVAPLADTFGPYCEVVLIDMTRPDHGIVSIHNGHVTNRKVGDPLGDTGLFDLAGRFPGQDSVVGYRTYTGDSRPLRSTTIFFRDKQGRPYAALAINYDLSLVQEMHRHAATMLDDSHIEKSAPIVGDRVGTLLDDLFAEAARQVGKAVPQFTKQDRVAVVRYLEEHGAFVIRGSMSAVARRLGVSRVAIYGYLEEVRAEAESEPEAGEGQRV
jgi:predicted transcriptional regulator YheO